MGAGFEVLPFERAEIIANLHNCLHLSDLSDFFADSQIFSRNSLLVDFTNFKFLKSVRYFLHCLNPSFVIKVHIRFLVMRSVEKGSSPSTVFQNFKVSF